VDDLIVLMKKCGVEDGIAILERPTQIGMFSVTHISTVNLCSGKANIE